MDETPFNGSIVIFHARKCSPGWNPSIVRGEERHALPSKDGERSLRRTHSHPARARCKNVAIRYEDDAGTCRSRLAMVASSFGRTSGLLQGHSAIQIPQDADSAK